MTTSVQQNTTANFLVPPNGQTNVLSLSLPANGNFGPAAGGGQYGVDFRSVGQVIRGQAFIPQAVTIDATGLTTGTYLTFSIPAINMNWLIYAGQTRTFQFPALPDLQVLVTPSSGSPTVNCAFFNYPALPDEQGGSVGTIQGSVAVSSLPDVTIGGYPTGFGTDYSANPLSLDAHLLLTIPANSGRLGFVIQNLSSDPVQVYLSESGSGGTIVVLNPAGGTGQAGGSIDFDGIPHGGQIDVYAPNALDAVSARAW